MFMQNDAGTCDTGCQESDTFLYRAFNTDGRLLYVGITNCLARRFDQHCGSPWFDDLHAILVEAFPTRPIAEFAEAWAIWTEGPAFNDIRRHPCGSRLPVYAEAYLDGADGVLASARSWLTVSSVYPASFEPTDPLCDTQPLKFKRRNGRGGWCLAVPAKQSEAHTDIAFEHRAALMASAGRKLRAWHEANQ